MLDQVIIDNHYNQDELRMGKHNDNKHLGKRFAGLFGDTLLDLVFGMVFLVGFGLVVSAIWGLIA